MANKFTREIDRLFDTYGPDKKIIILCNVGRHGYEEWDFYVFTHGSASRKSKAIDPDTDELLKKFSADKDKLDEMLLSSFKNVFDFEYESHDCDDDFTIWIYVTRDYQVCYNFTQCSLLTKENADKILIDLAYYPDDVADGLHDKQIVETVSELVDKINKQTAALESDDGKSKVRELLAKINEV